MLEVTGSASEIVHEPLPVDDPTQRQPDITLAREQLGWEPTRRRCATGSGGPSAYFARQSV